MKRIALFGILCLFQSIAIAQFDCHHLDTLPSPPSYRSVARQVDLQNPLCIKYRIEEGDDYTGNTSQLISSLANIYATIGIDLQHIETYTWTSPDPYTGSASDIIDALEINHAANQGDADFTLLLTGDGIGGRAGTVGGLCTSEAVGFSSHHDNVYVAAHEIGHILGAHHTHACKWNGNNTAIDGCGFNAGFGGCAGPEPAGGGTIMSYCHLRPVGVNLNFHPQVGNEIYNYVAAQTCLCSNPPTLVTATTTNCLLEFPTNSDCTNKTVLEYIIEISDANGLLETLTAANPTPTTSGVSIVGTDSPPSINVDATQLPEDVTFCFVSFTTDCATTEVGQCEEVEVVGKQ